MAHVDVQAGQLAAALMDRIGDEHRAGRLDETVTVLLLGLVAETYYRTVVSALVEAGLADAAALAAR